MEGQLQVASSRLAMIFALAAALAVSAQERPDFSGVWNQIDPSLSSESSHVVQIEQRGSLFNVKVQKSGPAGNMGYGFRSEHTYVIGAPPEPQKDNEGRVRTVSVDWEGDAIVFLRTTVEGANTTTEREVWSLSPDGTRLTLSRRTTDWKGTSTAQSTFQKRRNTPIARQVLDRLIDDRIAWTPRPEEHEYAYRGRLKFDRLLAGIMSTELPEGGTSPSGMADFYTLVGSALRVASSGVPKGTGACCKRAMLNRVGTLGRGTPAGRARQAAPRRRTPG